MRSLLILLVLLGYTSLSQGATKIKISGPAAVISYPLIVMAEQQSLQDKDIELEFINWKNPDQLRAMILGGEVQFSAMPSNLAAIFYNKGHKLTLMNISVWSVLWLMSTDPELKTLSQLKGKEVVVPFKNDMPDILFNQLLDAQLEQASDVAIRHSHNLFDASQLMLAGKVSYGLLIEPVASILELKSQSTNGVKLYRNMEISQLWRETFPQSPALPQAGIIANTNINQDKQLLTRFHHDYQQAALWCKAQTEACAEMVVARLPQLPLKAVVNAIKMTDLNAVKGGEARKSLESFYRVLADYNSDKIGGQLPDSGFYL